MSVALPSRRPTRPELAVFASGVTSMGMEILAGRMIAPTFGSSIYTWGSIIGVFLAALSYGYHRGGKRAATDASNPRMARVFLVTAAYFAVVIFAGDFLVRGSVGFSLPSRYASLPAVLVLFGPPTYLLGYVSPYAAQLSRKADVGEASGHVYALGTIGSIVGAFGTTFVLVPELAVDHIAFVFGAISVVVALALYAPNVSREHAAAVGAVALLLVAATGSGALGISPAGRIVYQTQTPYQDLEVVDSGDTRTLYLDGQRHSAMDKDDPRRHVFDYTRYFHLPLLMTDDVDRVLFVGGGGFTGPKRFAADYDVTVDVVEIDPVVVDVAKEYFRVEEGPNLNVYTMDGRQYLRETNRTYDLIVMDAYKQDKVPFQLTTREFFALANDRLDEDGVLLTNLISAPSGPASKFYRAEYKTLDRVFPQVYSFPTVGGSVVQNVEVIATKNATRVSEQQLLARNDNREIGIDLEREIETYATSPNTGDVPLLTDDYAPVDSLLDPMLGQRYVVQETNDTDDGNATANETDETDRVVEPVADDSTAGDGNAGATDVTVRSPAASPIWTRADRVAWRPVAPARP